MKTNETTTLTMTIDASFDAVAEELAEPAGHPEWATEFFAGPATPGPDGSVIAPVPAMGGDVQFRIESDKAAGIFDLYLTPVGAAYGPPLPVRLVRNGEGVDVLWILARPAGMPDPAWEEAKTSMQRELEQLKTMLEA